MFNGKVLKRLIPSISLISILAGCAATPVPMPQHDETTSWALKISHHTRLNPKGRFFGDAESDPMEHVGEAMRAKSGLGDAALAGAFAMAPKSGGIPVLDGLLFLDMLAGTPEPVYPFNFATTIAWLPVELAASHDEARDLFHDMRVNAIKQELDEAGATYEETVTDLREYFVAGTVMRQTTLQVHNAEGKLCDRCIILVVTNVPNKKTVQAPSYITGKPYEAYLFDGPVLNRTEDLHSWSRIAIQVRTPVENRKYRATLWPTRDTEKLAWWSKRINPVWAVEYIPQLTDRQLRDYEGGHRPSENPFPFMVHDGEIKHFVKGAN